MKTPRFEIGARVVSQDGSVSTVIGNKITADGITTLVEYAGRTAYPEAELQHADPASVAQVASLTTIAVGLNQRIEEAKAAARSKKRSR